MRVTFLLHHLHHDIDVAELEQGFACVRLVSKDDQKTRLFSRSVEVDPNRQIIGYYGCTAYDQFAMIEHRYSSYGYYGSEAAGYPRNQPNLFFSTSRFLAVIIDSVFPCGGRRTG